MDAHLAMLLTILMFAAFPLWMIVDASYWVDDPLDRAIWVACIAILWPIGALVYFFRRWLPRHVSH